MIYTTFETSHLKASKAMLKLENLEDTSQRTNDIISQDNPYNLPHGKILRA